MSIEESPSQETEISRAKPEANRFERQKRTVEQTIDAVLPD